MWPSCQEVLTVGIVLSVSHKRCMHRDGFDRVPTRVSSGIPWYGITPEFYGIVFRKLRNSVFHTESCIYKIPSSGGVPYDMEFHILRIPVFIQNSIFIRNSVFLRNSI